MNIMAKQIPLETSKAFFDQIEGLEMDVVRTNNKSRKVAWRITYSSLAVNFMMAFAIASLAPMHTVEWRLVRVDNAGPVEVVTTLDKAGQVFSEPNARYYLGQYVRMRESYIAAETSYNYHTVGLMSSKVTGEQQRYNEAVRVSNPDSPQRLFGRDGREIVTIESSSILDKQPNGKWLGQVDFSREDYKDKGAAAERTRWRATIGFEFHPEANMKDSDRLVNPFGLQVTSYHVDSVVK